MPTKTYHKLVRDHIPEIINADGKICVCEILSDEDYIYLLDQKLNEELAEYQESKSLEELADLLEVMQTVVKARGWTLEELEQVRANKAAKRGGFEKKILLKEVYTLSDYQDLALKIQNNQKAIIEKIPPQMLNTYYWLQDNLYLRNVSSDAEYKRKFAGYYRMRFVSQQYRDSFFSLFEAIKNDPDISFVDVARQLSQVDGRHEFSFISKMLHTIDPSRPIYDSQVDQALQIHRTYLPNIDAKIRQDEEILKQISFVYRCLEAASEMVEPLAAFDRIIPNRTMSIAKKLDFLLWALGGIEKK